jgi:hypothetical protein
MITRFNIYLEEREYLALERLSRLGDRDPREQIRFLIADAAQKNGLIISEVDPSTPSEPSRSDGTTRPPVR